VIDTRWLDENEQRAWRAFLASSHLLFDGLERQLQRDAGLPHTYYEILVQLSESPDHRLRMSELADTSLSSRSRVSHAVARLEEAGWVVRETCPTDKRGAFARLTEAGYAVLAAAAPGHVELVRSRLFDALTPEQVDQLRDICNAILLHMGPVEPRAARLLCPGVAEAARADADGDDSSSDCG
jgi:DNA-binding MarR family transcriptional regulator